MDSKDYQMTMGAQINNAVRLVANGIVELETEDIGAEIAELAQVLYDAVLPQMEKAASSGEARPTRTSNGGSKRPASGGKKPASKSGSKPSYGKMEGDITAPQAKLIRKLLEEKDHDNPVEFDDILDLSKKEASDIISNLMEAPDLF